MPEGTLGNNQGGGTADEIHKANPWLMSQYKTPEEQAKATPEAQKRMNQAVEDARVVREELETLRTESKDTFDTVIAERDAQIEKLNEEAARRAAQPTQPKYNPTEVARVEDLLSLPEGKGEAAIDWMRALNKWDRQQEQGIERTEVNKTAQKTQYEKVREGYTEDTMIKLAPEIRTAMNEYSFLLDNAGKDPNAVRKIVRLAELATEEKKAAGEAEKKLLEADKARLQAGGPGTPGGLDASEIERMRRMPLNELEKELGIGPEGEEGTTEKGFIFNP